jgi:hypothetical protein
LVDEAPNRVKVGNSGVCAVEHVKQCHPSQAGLVLALEALEFDAPTQFIVRCE